jgi:hypothetical protein
MLIYSSTRPCGRIQQSGYLLQPDHSDAIDVFDKSALLELRRAAHLQLVFKTSFSRLNPVPRGQATVIRPFIRGNRSHQQRTIQSDKLPTYLQSFTRFRPARPSQGSSELSSDISAIHRIAKTPGSLQINLLFTMYAEQAALIRVMQTFISSKDISTALSTPNCIGGAERDRTADPLLAKQVLSQLSYSPNHRNT